MIVFRYALIESVQDGVSFMIKNCKTYAAVDGKKAYLILICVINSKYYIPIRELCAIRGYGIEQDDNSKKLSEATVFSPNEIYDVIENKTDMNLQYRDDI